MGTTAGVFEDHFTDNNITSNPTWTANNNAFSVVNGILNRDGLHTDQSDRYLNGFNSHVSMPINDYLEYSYRGLLKSQGSPQTGLGTQLVLGSSQTDKNYSLNIQRGQTNGFPTNKYSLSLSYGTSGTITDLIVTNFQPNYDQFYNIKAVRVSGQWSLYVDGSLIGTAQDPGEFSQLENIVLYTVGSVAVDDIKVSTTPLPNAPNIEVYIGGINRGSYYVPQRGSMRQSFVGVNNGPVKINSTDASSIIAAERLIYKVNGVNTSFAEMMGLPNTQLDTTYWLPWYNNVDLDTQLRFANVSGTTAMVRVYIGGQEMTGSPFPLAAGESTRKSFPGINADR